MNTEYMSMYVSVSFFSLFLVLHTNILFLLFHLVQKILYFHYLSIFKNIFMWLAYAVDSLLNRFLVVFIFLYSMLSFVFVLFRLFFSVFFSIASVNVAGCQYMVICTPQHFVTCNLSYYRKIIHTLRIQRIETCESI